MSQSPYPTNSDRAAFANLAIDAFAFEVGIESEDAETQLGDLLCDLRHWCDCNGVCFADVDAGAHETYLEELEEEKQ